jgi:hypothetical protein
VDYGCVWITLQNDSRDIVLMPGMRFEIDREGRTLVTAEEDSRLRISLPAPWRDRIFAALANLLARFRQRAPGGAAAQKSPFAASFASTSGGSRRPVPYY